MMTDNVSRLATAAPEACGPFVCLPSFHLRLGMALNVSKSATPPSITLSRSACDIGGNLPSVEQLAWGRVVWVI